MSSAIASRCDASYDTCTSGPTEGRGDPALRASAREKKMKTVFGAHLSEEQVRARLRINKMQQRVDSQELHRRLTLVVQQQQEYAEMQQWIALAEEAMPWWAKFLHRVACMSRTDYEVMREELAFGLRQASHDRQKIALAVSNEGNGRCGTRRAECRRVDGKAAAR